MSSKCIILAGLIAALSITSGCGMTMLEKNRGKSFESAKCNQIADPKASKNLDPVVGHDGVAAEISTEKYQKGFGAPQGESVYNLQLGNISGIGESRGN
jgi:hypothetical protein